MSIWLSQLVMGGMVVRRTASLPLAHDLILPTMDRRVTPLRGGPAMTKRVA